MYLDDVFIQYEIIDTVLKRIKECHQNLGNKNFKGSPDKSFFPRIIDITWASK